MSETPITTSQLITTDPALPVTGPEEQSTTAPLLPDTDKVPVTRLQNLPDPSILSETMLFHQKKGVFQGRTTAGVPVEVDPVLYWLAPPIYREMPEWWLNLSEQEDSINPASHREASWAAAISRIVQRWLHVLNQYMLAILHRQ